jgi:hypothetical protein
MSWVLSSLIFMFQHSHHNSSELRPRCSFLRTKPSLRSVAYIQVLSTKIHRKQVFGAYHLYILDNVGDRIESCGTPACLSLAVDVSPSTEILNFHSEKEGIHYH